MKRSPSLGRGDAKVLVQPESAPGNLPPEVMSLPLGSLLHSAAMTCGTGAPLRA